MAAAQVLGLCLVAEPTQVDDVGNALLAGHASERLGGGTLPGREVTVCSPTHRVHEVIGHLDAAADTFQRVGTKQVSFAQLKPMLLERRRPAPVPHQAANIPTGDRQLDAEPSADEAGRAGDERSTGHVRCAEAPATVPSPAKAGRKAQAPRLRLDLAAAQRRHTTGLDPTPGRRNAGLPARLNRQ